MNDSLTVAFAQFKKDFENFRNREITPDNIEGFIGLRTLVNACEDFVARIHTIQRYTAYDQEIPNRMPESGVMISL